MKKVDHENHVDCNRLALTVISGCSVLIMAGTLIMNTYTLDQNAIVMEVIAKGIAPVEIDINIELSDKPFYLTSRFSRLVKGELNNTYEAQLKEIAFFIRNRGQKSVQYVNVYLEDPNQIFAIDSVSDMRLGGLDTKYIEFKAKYNKCVDTKGEEEYKEIKKVCDHDSLQPGLKNLLLVVTYENIERCYEFSICLYDRDQKEDWCEKNWKGEKHSLKELDECPDWRGLY